MQLRNAEGGHSDNGRHFGGDMDVELSLLSKLFTTKLLRDEPWGQSSVDFVTGTVCPIIWRSRKKAAALAVGVKVVVVVAAGGGGRGGLKRW
jgi:hypothetical protein